MTPAITDPRAAAASIWRGLNSGPGKAPSAALGGGPVRSEVGGAYGLIVGSIATRAGYHARVQSARGGGGDAAADQARAPQAEEHLRHVERTEAQLAHDVAHRLPA